ncbi:MAG TPA: macro domain-containing protein [Candidatus Thalassarchaeaceae archaeon]|jgi:O-acetyl-ADP-ribose deacetylase (regulator of RNase III)|nr:macro domain-containing protein [Candidatus Thalassarchaeaceae archaeon]MDP7648808.1 macro domain-containing protein [Candidatus Thalassarchaeaceae archaeon]HJL54418.1 macro domain-containing protein [Candidatus Thalassarchaeaceae archaeon]HJM77554.1 macro domain-containing protein [Candidatus Thalassarchaeaceae archaeon]|tara:strand:+ start:151416 stop:152057 length:642 start_codon:yes stop_codon:yes gene_type:complete
MADVVIVRECRHGQVRVLYGDIVKVEGDVMVIPANNRLAGREGLDERMQQAAGPGLREHCVAIAKEKRKLNLQPCSVGEAVSTPSFDLPASNLVHVVGPDCRRPTQDNFRRELLRNSYGALFEEVEGLEPRDTLVLPPLGMDVFAYPHREGARMTMEIILAWMDSEDDPGVKMVLIVTHEDNFLNNMKTVYRESEDQFPGVDRTRDYRKGKIQ